MLRVGTLCSGYDSQCMALDRIKAVYSQFDYELMFWCEIDRYAIQAHNAVYPQWCDRNLGDMTSVEWFNVDKVDLLTYSTPCTDISIAGRMKGLEIGSGTRSSILWNTEAAIRELRPRYLLMENVKGLVSKKFLPSFKKWQNVLTSYGYTNYTAILDASDYGVPQHRERVFMVSILGEAAYSFPEPYPLAKCMRDILESDVDELFYLSDKQLDCLYRDTADRLHGQTMLNGDSLIDDNYIKVKQIGNLVDDSIRGYKNPHRGRVYDVDGLAPTLNANSGGNLEPKILLRPHGFSRGAIQNIAPTVTASAYECNNFVIDSMQANTYRGTLDGVSPTITCGMGGGQTPMIGVKERIRKLTPRECFRLMDVAESDIDKIQATGISKSQQYKLAGNSIVVACLYHIFRKMFIDIDNESKHLKLF